MVVVVEWVVVVVVIAAKSELFELTPQNTHDLTPAPFPFSSWPQLAHRAIAALQPVDEKTMLCEIAARGT